MSGVSGNISIIGGGSIVVNGQRVMPGADGVVGVGSGEVVLKIGIPAKHLGHLKAISLNGDIAVRGAFVNGHEKMAPHSFRVKQRQYNLLRHVCVWRN